MEGITTFSYPLSHFSFKISNVKFVSFLNFKISPFLYRSKFFHLGNLSRAIPSRTLQTKLIGRTSLYQMPLFRIPNYSKKIILREVGGREEKRERRKELND
jgi:hypothetical protein